MRSESQSIETADLALDTATAEADAKLEALLATPSRSTSAFADKLHALEAEYGCDWQPRHVRSLLADLTIFAS